MKKTSAEVLAMFERGELIQPRTQQVKPTAAPPELEPAEPVETAEMIRSDLIRARQRISALTIRNDFLEHRIEDLERQLAEAVLVADREDDDDDPLPVPPEF